MARNPTRSVTVIGIHFSRRLLRLSLSSALSFSICAAAYQWVRVSLYVKCVCLQFYTYTFTCQYAHADYKCKSEELLVCLIHDVANNIITKECSQEINWLWIAGKNKVWASGLTEGKW